ncbi:hypothetical protein H8E77_16995 [bacterium]|nr:hypothetical protein [bacterium]
MFLHYFKKRGKWERENFGVLLDSNDADDAWDFFVQYDQDVAWSRHLFDYEVFEVQHGTILIAQGFDRADLAIKGAVTIVYSLDSQN